MLARAPTTDAMSPATPEAMRHGWHRLAVRAALMSFASISTDLYLPAMPAMGHALDASAGSVEWTVSGYLIGISLGQLLWGPIGDRFGRRLPVAAGLVLFAIGSTGCALAGSIPTMIGWRVVQALGACASVVLARAMVRDLYAGARAAQMMSTLMTVMAIAPLLGPLVGGQILALSGWRAIFWVLVAVSATLAALFTIPETLAPERRPVEPLRRALRGYGALRETRLSSPISALAGSSTAACSPSSPARHSPRQLLPRLAAGIRAAVRVERGRERGRQHRQRPPGGPDRQRSADAPGHAWCGGGGACAGGDDPHRLGRAASSRAAAICSGA